jgi:hypothetical protein
MHPIIHKSDQFIGHVHPSAVSLHGTNLVMHAHGHVIHAGWGVHRVLLAVVTVPLFYVDLQGNIVSYLRS